MKKKYDHWWKKYWLEKTELGDFIETKAKNSPTSPSLVSPVLSYINVKSMRININTNTYIDSPAYGILNYIRQVTLKWQRGQDVAIIGRTK